LTRVYDESPDDPLGCRRIWKLAGMSVAFVYWPQRFDPVRRGHFFHLRLLVRWARMVG